MKRILKWLALIFASLCVLVIGLFVFFLVSWWMSERQASVTLEDGTEVSLHIRPMLLTYMIGLHSDYHRRLSVNTGGLDYGHQLFADTGWWRGSLLYRMADGGLLLHEGQNGCFTLTDAHGKARVRSADCPVRTTDDAPDECGEASNRPAPSWQFDNAVYIGQFGEGGYIGHAQRGECPIPDPL